MMFSLGRTPAVRLVTELRNAATEPWVKTVINIGREIVREKCRVFAAHTCHRAWAQLADCARETAHGVHVHGQRGEADNIRLFGRDDVNADAVDGLSASKKPRAGKLLALDRSARFPSSVLPSVARGPRGLQGPAGAPGPTGPRVRRRPTSTATTSATTSRPRPRRRSTSCGSRRARTSWTSLLTRTPWRRELLSTVNSQRTGSSSSRRR